MHNKARPCTLVAWFTLSAVVTAGPVSPAGYEAKAQQLEWATRAGGPGEDLAEGLATTPGGAVYVSRSFTETAIFGEGEPNQTELTSAGSLDVFVAKYDPDGALLWATRAGGPGIDLAPGLATTPGGDSVVTGSFQGTAIFGEGEPNQTELTSVGGDDIFVAKYDPDGALLWATRAGGESGQGGVIATTPGGDSYVSGIFSGTAIFGEGELNQTELTSVGDFDIFVAKYDPDGALLWATRAGGPGFDESWEIVTTPGGEYVTGRFLDYAIVFGEGELNQTELTNAGSMDIFVAKYDPDGALLWATRAGGPSFDEGHGLATTPGGDSVVTGFFFGTVIFGEGEPKQTELTSGVGSDIFVAKYDPDGALLWATRAGDTLGDEGNAIATTRRGNSFVTGRFSGTAIFGEGEPNQTELTSAGLYNIFVAKYDPDGALLLATRAGGAESNAGDAGWAIATTPGGDSCYLTGPFAGTAIFGEGEPNQTELTSAGGFDIFVAKFR